MENSNQDSINIQDTDVKLQVENISLLLEEWEASPFSTSVILVIKMVSYKLSCAVQ